MAGEEPLLDASMLARLERLELSVRRLSRGDPRGEISTRRRGGGLLFQDHRPYVHGDDPRLLDWNAYLRLGELLIRESAAEESPRLICFLDVSRSMTVRDGAKFHAAKRLAAAIGAVSLMRGQAISFAPFPTGREPEVFVGRERLWPFLRALTALKDAQVRSDWGASFEVVVRSTRARGVACVISDFFAEDEPIRALAALRRRGFATRALEVVDPRDLQILPGERVVLQDAESGRLRREKLDAASIRRYLELLADHRRRLAESCRAERIQHRSVSTTEDLEPVMVDLLLRGALSD